MSDAKTKGAKRQIDALEIESLNVDQLDVEELEQRLELATGVPAEMGWVCDCDGHCTNCQDCTLCTCNGTNDGCPTYCGADCPSNCAYLCSMDCGLDTCLALAPEIEEPV